MMHGNHLPMGSTSARSPNAAQRHPAPYLAALIGLLCLAGCGHPAPEPAAYAYPPVYTEYVAVPVPVDTPYYNYSDPYYTYNQPQTTTAPPAAQPAPAAAAPAPPGAREAGPADPCASGGCDSSPAPAETKRLRPARRG